MITSGEGKYKVWLEKREIDGDLIYILGGGEKSHIGGVIICEQNKSPNIVKLERHQDYINDRFLCFWHKLVSCIQFRYFSWRSWNFSR